jgi:hypothetical protein
MQMQRGHSSYCAHADARAPIRANADAGALTRILIHMLSHFHIPLLCLYTPSLPPSLPSLACMLAICVTTVVALKLTAFAAAARRGTASCCRPKEYTCIREGAGERDGEYILLARRNKAGDEQRLRGACARPNACTSKCMLSRRYRVLEFLSFKIRHVIIFNFLPQIKGSLQNMREIILLL